MYGVQEEEEEEEEERGEIMLRNDFCDKQLVCSSLKSVHEEVCEGWMDWMEE